MNFWDNFKNAFRDKVVEQQLIDNYRANGLNFFDRYSARPLATGISYAPEAVQPVQHINNIGTPVTGNWKLPSNPKPNPRPMSDASRAYLQQYIDTVSDPNYGVVPTVSPATPRRNSRASSTTSYYAGLDW